jgi:predicted AAA+ superfamily ATPase
VGRGAYAEMLLRGGFPEAQRRSNRDRFFDSYVASIVERDVTETSRVHDPLAVGTLLGLVAARSGSLARYDSLAREIGVDGKTAKGYVDAVRELPLGGSPERPLGTDGRTCFLKPSGRLRTQPRLLFSGRSCAKRSWSCRLTSGPPP